jgi:hypothetical protein
MKSVSIRCLIPSSLANSEAMVDFPIPEELPMSITQGFLRVLPPGANLSNYIFKGWRVIAYQKHILLLISMDKNQIHDDK